MEVLSPRSALLANYEVLALLKELEHDHLERSKAAMRIKKEDSSGVHTLPDISENLRTIQVEAIQYLSSDYLPTNQQTPESVARLTKDLAAYELTKAEKLQIVNLAPTLPVELYVIIEELEDRLGDQMDSILDLVKSSLPEPEHALLDNDTEPAAVFFSSTATSLLQEPTAETGHHMLSSWDEDADAIVDDVEFVDHGEGAGIEGDLDMNDE